MHPTLIEYVTRAHQGDLRRRAERVRHLQRRRRTTGEHVGWMRVSIGLRLAVGGWTAAGDRIDLPNAA